MASILLRPPSRTQNHPQTQLGQCSHISAQWYLGPGGDKQELHGISVSLPISWLPPTGVMQCRTPPRPAADAASCWGCDRLGPSWRILEISGRAWAEHSQEGAAGLGTSLFSLGSEKERKSTRVTVSSSAHRIAEAENRNGSMDGPRLRPHPHLHPITCCCPAVCHLTPS